jgi:hypothetical protein
MIITCDICKRRGFRSWDQYREHHRRQHSVTDDMGLPRLDFSDQARAYVPMDPAEKQAEVTRGETAIREIAWTHGRLNPLIGCDKVSIEPKWDSERNIL